MHNASAMWGHKNTDANITYLEEMKSTSMGSEQRFQEVYC